MKLIKICLILALCFECFTSVAFADTTDLCSKLANTSWSGKMHVDFYNTETCMNVTLKIDGPATPTANNKGASLPASINIKPSRTMASNTKIPSGTYTNKAYCVVNSSHDSATLTISASTQVGTISLETNNLNSGSGVFKVEWGTPYITPVTLYNGGNPNASCDM